MMLTMAMKQCMTYLESIKRSLIKYQFVVLRYIMYYRRESYVFLKAEKVMY